MSIENTSNSAYAIKVTDIHKSYGDLKALNGVSLSVERGSVLGLLGPNGAGKTTLVKILTTLLKPDTGFVHVAGIDAIAHPTDVRNHIGLAGQNAAVDGNLTGFENLELFGRLYHMNKTQAKEKADYLIKRFSLTEAAHRPLKTYSGGMRRRLDLAASLVGEPEILFLDEPTTGLDPRSRMELWEIIEELVRGQVTVLLTTQYLEEADYLADSIVVIDHGTVVARGTASDLKAQIGGNIVELHLEDKTKLIQAADLLENITDQKPSIDEITGRIHLSTTHGAQTLQIALKKLNDADIAIEDIELRKPTLDEVFLSLTDKNSR